MDHALPIYNFVYDRNKQVMKIDINCPNNPKPRESPGKDVCL